MTVSGASLEQDRRLQQQAIDLTVIKGAPSSDHIELNRGPIQIIMCKEPCVAVAKCPRLATLVITCLMDACTLVKEVQTLLDMYRVRRLVDEEQG